MSKRQWRLIRRDPMHNIGPGAHFCAPNIEDDDHSLVLQVRRALGVGSMQFLKNWMRVGIYGEHGKAVDPLAFRRYPRVPKGCCTKGLTIGSGDARGDKLPRPPSEKHGESEVLTADAYVTF